MGLPPDDPLRFDASGELLSKEALDTLLGSIIDSWPTWDQTVRRHDTQVMTSPPERRASLSGENEAPRRSEWLSR
jgi:hypothetical protein